VAAAVVVDVAPPPGAEEADVEGADVELARLLLHAATTHTAIAITETVARRFRRTAVPLVSAAQRDLHPVYIE
jgi:hypothetical protein